MKFTERPNWCIDDSGLRLMERICEGKFATIYRAEWSHDKTQETVVAKMLKGKKDII